MSDPQKPRAEKAEAESVMARLLERARSEIETPFERRVFVNRTLRMETIGAICFDLDWTLAAYDREALQRMIFDTALDRLVGAFGYDESILAATFRPDFAHRGLLIDKTLGTVIKMDRHFYVGRGYLGRRRLTRSERMECYRRERVDLRRSRFYHVDTLFELAEVNLFSEIVEQITSGIIANPRESFEALANDIRTAVDDVHRDGTLKTKIVAHLDDLLPRDAELVLTIRKLALTGRKILLVSNSEWLYTNAICRHLFDPTGTTGWRHLFDAVIVSAGKPQFFTSEQPFLELDEQGRVLSERAEPRWGGIFAGGSSDGLGRLLDLPGERVLYVGDHIYSDILTTKTKSTWRTMLIVSELEDELRARHRLVEDIDRLTNTNGVIADLGQRVDNARDVVTLHRLVEDAGPPAAAASVAATVDQLTAGHEVLRQRARLLNGKITGTFNAYWGSVFKQGSSKSLFGHQVDAFACLYTSRVTNLLYYGNSHYFRVIADPMIHETVR